MIAYRAEVWCDGIPEGHCQAGYGLGTPHDDAKALPSLARNLEHIRMREGWVKDGPKHYCPECWERRPHDAG